MRRPPEERVDLAPEEREFVERLAASFRPAPLAGGSTTPTARCHPALQCGSQDPECSIATHPKQCASHSLE